MCYHALINTGVANMDITVSLPKLIQAVDYHDFKFIQSVLETVMGNPVKVYEVGYNNDAYIGLIFLGDLPCDDTINQLIAESGIILLDKDD